MKSESPTWSFLMSVALTPCLVSSATSFGPNCSSSPCSWNKQTNDAEYQEKNYDGFADNLAKNCVNFLLIPDNSSAHILVTLLLTCCGLYSPIPLLTLLPTCCGLFAHILLTLLPNPHTGTVRHPN
jgi:hypothetical protein